MAFCQMEDCEDELKLVAEERIFKKLSPLRKLARNELSLACLAHKCHVSAT